MNSSEKTATLLKLLGRAPYVHSVTELGEQISCSKSGTFKLLASLVKTGLAAQTPEHKYTLGPAVYVLVKPYLVRLRDMTGENASFSMLINGKAILIYREESQQLVRVMGNVGQERPLYAGATGKILGAYQEESVIRKRLMEEPMKAFTENTILSPEGLLNEYAKIREQGYAISDGELNSETIGIGAPIYDESGNVWAAVSIGAPKMRVDAVKMERYIFLIREIAKEMSEQMTQGESISE